MKTEIEMAKEAGLIHKRGNLDVVQHSITQLERFAAIVREDEREKIKQLRDVHEAQGQDGSWNVNPYMTGLFNGLELALSIFEGREPDYREPTIEAAVLAKREACAKVCEEVYVLRSAAAAIRARGE